NPYSVSNSPLSLRFEASGASFARASLARFSFNRSVASRSVAASKAFRDATARAGSGAAPRPSTVEAIRMRKRRRKRRSSLLLEAGGATDRGVRRRRVADLIKNAETDGAGTGEEAADRAVARVRTQDSRSDRNGEAARVEFHVVERHRRRVVNIVGLGIDR